MDIADKRAHHHLTHTDDSHRSYKRSRSEKDSVSSLRELRDTYGRFHLYYRHLIHSPSYEDQRYMSEYIFENGVDTKKEASPALVDSIISILASPSSHLLLKANASVLLSYLCHQNFELCRTLKAQGFVRMLCLTIRRYFGDLFDADSTPVRDFTEGREEVSLGLISDRVASELESHNHAELHFSSSAGSSELFSSLDVYDDDDEMDEITSRDLAEKRLYSVLAFCGGALRLFDALMVRTEREEWAASVAREIYDILGLETLVVLMSLGSTLPTQDTHDDDTPPSSPPCESSSSYYDFQSPIADVMDESSPISESFDQQGSTNSLFLNHGDLVDNMVFWLEFTLLHIFKSGNSTTKMEILGSPIFYRLAQFTSGVELVDKWNYFDIFKYVVEDLMSDISSRRFFAFGILAEVCRKGEFQRAQDVLAPLDWLCRVDLSLSTFKLCQVWDISLDRLVSSYFNLLRQLPWHTICQMTEKYEFCANMVNLLESGIRVRLIVSSLSLCNSQQAGRLVNVGLLELLDSLLERDPSLKDIMFTAIMHMCCGHLTSPSPEDQGSSPSPSDASISGNSLSFASLPANRPIRSRSDPGVYQRAVGKSSSSITMPSQAATAAAFAASKFKPKGDKASALEAANAFLAKNMDKLVEIGCECLHHDEAFNDDDRHESESFGAHSNIHMRRSVLGTSIMHATCDCGFLGCTHSFKKISDPFTFFSALEDFARVLQFQNANSWMRVLSALTTFIQKTKSLDYKFRALDCLSSMVSHEHVVVDPRVLSFLEAEVMPTLVTCIEEHQYASSILFICLGALADIFMVVQYNHGQPRAAVWTKAIEASLRLCVLINLKYSSSSASSSATSSPFAISSSLSTPCSTPLPHPDTAPSFQKLFTPTLSKQDAQVRFENRSGMPWPDVHAQAALMVYVFVYQLRNGVNWAEIGTFHCVLAMLRHASESFDLSCPHSSEPQRHALGPHAQNDASQEVFFEICRTSIKILHILFMSQPQRMLSFFSETNLPALLMGVLKNAQCMCAECFPLSTAESKQGTIPTLISYILCEYARLSVEATTSVVLSGSLPVLEYITATHAVTKGANPVDSSGVFNAVFSVLNLCWTGIFSLDPNVQIQWAYILACYDSYALAPCFVYKPIFIQTLFSLLHHPTHYRLAAISFEKIALKIISPRLSRDALSRDQIASSSPSRSDSDSDSEPDHYTNNKSGSQSLVTTTKDLLTSGDLSDVIFTFDEIDDEATGRPSVLHAHRAILFRSHVFKRMFKSGLQESSSPHTFSSHGHVAVHVKDVAKKLFYKLLEFLYTDNVDFTNVSPNDILDLVKLADRYQIQDLIKLCDRQLSSLVSTSDPTILVVLECWKHANAHKLHILNEWCLDWIAVHFSLFIDTQEGKAVLICPGPTSPSDSSLISGLETFLPTLHKHFTKSLSL